MNKKNDRGSREKPSGMEFLENSRECRYISREDDLNKALNHIDIILCKIFNKHVFLVSTGSDNNFIQKKVTTPWYSPMSIQVVNV